jgi:cytochrome P450
MTHFCPAYPHPRKNKASRFLMFFSARRSWLDSLSERSYRMQMGEVHLPGLDLYMVNEPALVRRVLVGESASFPKSALMGDAFRPLLGDSILTTNGAQWARQRAMMEPAFAQARVQVAFPLMWDAVQAMLARLNTLPNGFAHDMEVEMTHVTADIIFRTIFSQPLAGEAAHRIFAAFARFQSLAPRLLLPSVYGLRWLVSPWDVWRSRRAAREIRGLLEALVKPRFDACHLGAKAEAHPPGNASPQDVLEVFLNARDPVTGEPFAFDEVVDQVAMLFLAGHETSASALTWALYLLAQAPAVQERMHREAVALGAKGDTDASAVKSLALARNVFRETLRLFPPVGFLARQSAQSCPMRDKTVEQGASVVISPWLIQRHHSLWREPDAFNPDRYENDASRDSLRDAYLPFGMGPRVCMGAAFAQQEAVLILSSIVREYRLEAVPGHVPQPVGRLTIRSANGVRLTLHRRAMGESGQVPVQGAAADAAKAAVAAGALA